MVRQRIRADRSPLAYVGRLLLILLCLGLVWYGLMLVLLALKFSPDTVNRVSGYRSVYDALAGLEPDDVTGRVRWIAAVSGIAAFLVFGFLAWKEIPRPYLARGDLRLEDDRRGVLSLSPRAVERIAEAAAREHAGVTGAAGRYGGEEMALNVSVRSRDVAAVLRDVRRGVEDALARHGLPVVPVSVTVTRFDRQGGRDLK